MASACKAKSGITVLVEDAAYSLRAPGTQLVHEAQEGVPPSNDTFGKRAGPAVLRIYELQNTDITRVGMWFKEELARRGWTNRESPVDDYLFKKRIDAGCIAFSISEISPSSDLRQELPEGEIAILMRVVDRLRPEPDC